MSKETTSNQTEKPLPNSKLEEAFYKVASYDRVQTFRKLKAEGNTASATALATRVVIDETLYPLLELRPLVDAAEGLSIPDCKLLDREPDINNHPEMLA